MYTLRELTKLERSCYRLYTGKRGKRAVLVIDHQSFQIMPYDGTAEDVRFYRRSLAIALARLMHRYHIARTVSETITRDLQATASQAPLEANRAKPQRRRAKR